MARTKPKTKAKTKAKKPPLERYVWNDNLVQFTRMLAEANAAGAFTPRIIKLMARSMDLPPVNVKHLIDRAEGEFEAWKRGRGPRQFCRTLGFQAFKKMCRVSGDKIGGTTFVIGGTRRQWVGFGLVDLEEPPQGGEIYIYEDGE